MAQDIFLKLNGIDGESQDATHLNEIDIATWTWQISQDSAMMSGSGGGAGRSTVADISLTHKMDRSSPNLAKYCFTGKHIPEAILTMRKAGGTPFEYARITMSDVVISHFAPIATGLVCQETFRLSFARMKYEYMLQNALGGSGGVVTSLIDVKENRSS
ncbi:Hcp family type VI secretion system effector [Caballeronia sp. KNU42]